MRHGWLVATACCWSVAAMAQDAPRPRVVLTGTGSVRTPPDLATINYRIVGEGATSDEAVSAMAARRRRIDAGLASLGGGLDPRASEVALSEIRGPECRQSYGQPQLSTGACSIIGYSASLQVSIRTGQVRQAGTAVGLIGRLGGKDPQIGGFALADAGAAERRAIAAALADAKAKAQAIAVDSGMTLGRLQSVSTTGYGGNDEIVVTGSRVVPAPPAPPPPPPIAVDLAPRPIETRAQVTVSYEIAS